MAGFSHLNASGEANMVDVSDKQETRREAMAEGFLHVSDEVITAISDHKVMKGDVFAVARPATESGT